MVLLWHHSEEPFPVPDGTFMFPCVYNMFQIRQRDASHTILYTYNKHLWLSAGSILFLCCISLHRFMGICHPVRSLYWVSARRAKLVSVALWACVLLIQAPILYFSRTRWIECEYLSFLSNVLNACLSGHYTDSPWCLNGTHFKRAPFLSFFLRFNAKRRKAQPFHNPKLYSLFFRVRGSIRICYDTTSPELFDDFLVYSSVVSVLMFALPFMVVMVSYGLMVQKLLEPGWGSEEGGSAQKTKQKSVKMIIVVLATFMLCFLPFHLTRSLYYSFRYLRQMDPSQVRPAFNYRTKRKRSSFKVCHINFFNPSFFLGLCSKKHTQTKKWCISFTTRAIWIN